MNKLDVNILRLLFSVMLLISGVNSYALDKADSVFVDKSESRLYLMRDGVAFRDIMWHLVRTPKVTSKKRAMNVPQKGNIR